MLLFSASHAGNVFIRVFMVRAVCANFSVRKSKKSELSKFRVFLSAPADYVVAPVLCTFEHVAPRLAGDGE